MAMIIGDYIPIYGHVFRYVFPSSRP